MSVTCCEIHETSFRYYIYPVAIIQLVTNNILPGRLDLDGHLPQTHNIYLAIKMTCIAAYRTVLHLKEMFLDNHRITARDSHKDITGFRRLLHLHDLESIHHGLHSLDRIHFSHNNLCSKAFRSHGHTLATPAITGHNYILACHDKVGRTVDTIPDRLTCTITVIEKMLAVRIVHQHHREAQLLCVVKLDKSENTGRRLLASADHIRDKLPILGVHQVDQISSVVYYDVRAYLQHSSYMSLILLRSRVIPCKHIETGLHKGRCHIILSRKRVTSGHIHFRTTGSKHFTEIRRLGFEVNGKGNLKSFERERLPELRLKSVQQRHMMPYPINFQSAVLPELRIPYFT